MCDVHSRPHSANGFADMPPQSYANAIVSSVEDPEKMLDQTVNEMNDDLIKLRQATAQVRCIKSCLCFER